MRARFFLTVPALLLLALSLGMTTPAAAHEQTGTTLSIAGTLTGPSGPAKVGVSVRGPAAQLSGSGGSARLAVDAPATFTFSGTLDGSVVTLHGQVVHAAFEFLEGTPVTLVADTRTRTIDVSVGPIPAGPQAGQVLTFTGTAEITIDAPHADATTQRST